MTDEDEPVTVAAVHSSLSALERPLDALRRATFAHLAHAASTSEGVDGPGGDDLLDGGSASTPARATLKPKRKRSTP